MATNDKYIKINKEVFKGNNGTQFRIINDRLTKLEQKVDILLSKDNVTDDFKDDELKKEVKDIYSKIDNIIKPHKLKSPTLNNSTIKKSTKNSNQNLSKNNIKSNTKKKTKKK